jgi:hypothetical protein
LHRVPPSYFILGHYTKENDDRKFKEELKRRNDREAEIKRGKAITEESLRNLKKWEINNFDENTGFFNEIGEMVKAKLEMFNANALEIVMKNEMVRAKAQECAHEVERKRAWSARRAAKHSRPRNREKIKIPAPPGEDDKSSATYYTSTTSDSDSIPEIRESET